MAKQIISEIKKLINGRIAAAVSETENKCHSFDFEMIFDALTVRAFQIAKDHGWHEQERNNQTDNQRLTQKINNRRRSTK